MDILVIGSSNTDLTVRAGSIPKPGETVLGSGFKVDAGGKGANQAVGAARLGAGVTFSCMLGCDAYGEQSVRNFRNENIDTSYVFTCPGEASGVALITVDSKGENCIVVASGANLRFTPADVDKIGDLSRFSLVLAQLEIPVETVAYAASLCRRSNVPFVLNPAPAARLPESMYADIDVITPNETEAEILTGIRVTDGKSAETAAKSLCDKGVKTVIITLGSKGAYIYSEGRGRLVKAWKVDAVDTTAAGDIFNAGFCVARASGKDVDSAVSFASAASAIAVTRRGAQSSAPYYDEVIEFMNTNNKTRQ